MILGCRLDNPKLLIVVGMTGLALANAGPRFVPAGWGVSSDWMDGIRGGLFGIAIPLLLRAAWINGQRRRGN